MKKIYKGNLRTVKVTKLEIEDGVVKRFEYVRPIIKEDILFYQGIAGKQISLEYRTVLPEEGEAVEIVKQDLRARTVPEMQPYPTCIFYNENEIEPYKEITNKEFRKIKKEYKKNRSR